jgi:hypothetical protein
MRFLLIAVLLFAGCSSSIDQWADRGLAGVTLEQGNVLASANQAQALLNQQRQADLDALIADLSAAITAGTADANWIKDHRAAMSILLQQWDEQRNQIDAAKQISQVNLDQIAESFRQIKRVRQAWGDEGTVQSQVDSLTTLVIQAIQARGTK